MNITREQLSTIYPFAKSKIDQFLDPLNMAMMEFHINTPKRQAAFLAQIGHESGQLRYVKELASGLAYEGRKDLGNVVDGDGVRFKGRGLIQITGRANYLQVQIDLGIPCIANPELLENTVNACRTAGWFWDKRGLNALADKGDFVTITKRINGGLNGQEDRLRLYQVALGVLL